MYLFNLVPLLYFIIGYVFTGADAGLLDSLGDAISRGITTNRPRYPPTNNNNNYRPNNNRNFNTNYNKEPVYDEIINSNDDDPNYNQQDRRFNSETTTKKPAPNRGSLELTDKELIAVQKYPELTNLLNKLKEMNKQKELEKQNNKNKPIDTEGSTNTQNNLNKPSNAGIASTTQRPNDEVKDKNGWVQLKKRKIFFKAKPVRPENEIGPTDKEEIIYYLD